MILVDDYLNEKELELWSRCDGTRTGIYLHTAGEVRGLLIELIKERRLRRGSTPKNPGRTMEHVRR